MIKILINEEEVVCKNNIKINEKMLSTSSVVLNNCYPKSWEETKDYVSNFYFPKDYAKCKIIDKKNVNFEIVGSTTQDGTPTPDNPVPIVNKTGTIQETIHGKDYTFDLGDIELCKIGTYEDYIKKSTGKNLFDKNTATILNAYINASKVIVSSNNDRVAYIECEPNTTYTISKMLLSPTSSNKFRVITTSDVPAISTTGIDYVGYNTGTEVTNITITTSSNARYLAIYMYYVPDVSTTLEEMLSSIQVEKGSQATNYEPYGVGKWYVYKKIGKITLDENSNWSKQTNYYNCTTNLGAVSGQGYCNYYAYGGTTTPNSFWLTANAFRTNDSTDTLDNYKTWLSTHNLDLYYIKGTGTGTEITDTTLLNQLNSVGEDLIFCGVVKNTGKISLNPREPHYVDLQVLDFKTLLSEGETLNYVITDKTIVEAINQVVNTIADYGFQVGTINIQNPNDMINAYSTLNKTAYDVFQYIADITQSRWTTRMIDENMIAIDFIDPLLETKKDTIEYTKEYFADNEIVDMSFNYSTTDYRNKQIMTSDEVYGNIIQTETKIADGYSQTFICENKIGTITSIKVNGVDATFMTKNQQSLGYSADFVYTPGKDILTSTGTETSGSIITLSYYPIVQGREIVLDASEISRISTQTNRNGTISRYENRNDTTSSAELQKIGESYIKYKGKAEIKLKIISKQNLFNKGDIVDFDAPLDELSTEYMVKDKAIDMYLATDEVFYTFELCSNYNSEDAINYFDNQRAKNQGNIGEGETIVRDIDLENKALIIFYDTEVEQVQTDNPTTLDFALDGILI